MLESGDTIGRYRIVRLLGAGGMGEVYLAEDTELRRRVALKLFTRELPSGAEARDHLLHEARAASSLSHPNVCTIFEVGEDEDRAFISMEYVEGRSLDSLKARGELSTDQVVRYGAQIADAIAHAHDHGVVHRDLKSANVVIAADGRAKVLDFGLASTAAGGADAATRDVTSAEVGKVSGTLAYMAPEVLRGQPADTRSDIWALGVVLFETSTGGLPFTGDTAFAVSTAIMKESIEIPANLAAGLKTVIQRCLQKAPGERYQSAAEVRAALEMLQSGSPSGVVPDEVVAAAAARGATAPSWPLIGGGIVVGVLSLLGWWAFGLGSSDMEVNNPGPPAAEAAIGASGRPTIAVLPFRDRTNTEETEWLADGVPSMLLTSLAQTPGLDVVSNTRVQEIVAQLGSDSLADLDAATLAQFATRSGAGAVVVGDLYFTGSEYRVDVQVEDVANGRVLDAYSATGPFVFELVDELSGRIREGLNLGGAAPPISIAEARTDSAAAMVAYDRGTMARQNVRYGDAVADFEEALRHDPDFVMAHFQLADLRNYLPDPTRADEHWEYVRANIERIPDRDRLYVDASFALEAEDFDTAGATLEELLRRYPDHEYGWVRLAAVYGRSELGFNDTQIDALERAVDALPASGVLHNQLGYAMLFNGRYTEAVQAIERYVELYPEEPNAYDSLAEMYTASGNPEAGLERYTAILDVDADWAGAYLGRAMNLGMLGRYDEALEEIDKYQEVAIGNGQLITSHAMVKAYLLARLGRYREAVEVLDSEIESAARFGVVIHGKGLEMAGADLALEAEDYGNALDYTRRGLLGVEGVEIMAARRDIELSARTLTGVIHIRAGDLEPARRILAELEAAPQPNPVWGVELLRGELALVSGDLDQAEASFRTLQPEIKAPFSMSAGPPTILGNNAHLRDGLARVAVARGDLDGAIRRYRDLLTVDLGSKYNAFVDPRYILELARLLDQAGQADEAVEQYELFLDLWKDADDRFQPLIDEARERVAALGG